MQKLQSAGQFAEKLGISKRRIEALCAQGRIKGAQKLGAGRLAPWMIPYTAPDPRHAPGRPAEKKGKRKPPPF